MKKIIIALILVAFSALYANADWLGEFMDIYKNKNIDDAVEQAVKNGVTPDDIVENGLTIATLSPPDLIKALYCAGVSGEDIYNAAQKYNVSELIVTEGFRKSKDECGDIVTDTQPYTPAGTEGRGFGGADRGQRGKLFASPSAP